VVLAASQDEDEWSGRARQPDRDAGSAKLAVHIDVNLAVTVDGGIATTR
jgi:hypothetical protein